MGIPYETQENKAFQTALRLIGPLVFYELCAEAAAWACSLFGTQNALAVTGGGALLAIPFLYAAYKKRPMVGAGQRKPEPVQSRKLVQRVGCAFSALAGIGACLGLNALLQVLISPSNGWNSTREAVYGASFPVQLLVTVLLASPAEELLFRGLIRTELRSHMGPHRAAFLGALLFGLYHGNVSQGIYAFFLALCLEQVCEWSGSLLPAICLHAGANGAAICLTALTSGTGVLADLSLQSIALMGAGVILTAVALYKTKEVFCKS